MNSRTRMLLAATGMGLALWTVQAANVNELWTKNCGSCHGKDGRAKTPAGRKAGALDLTDPKVQEKFTDEQMFKAVKEGVKDGDKTKMKPAETLTDAEIRKLIGFVRSLKK